MQKQMLINEIKKKKSFLCVGLDSDIEKIPMSIKKSVNKSDQFEFNRRIIDSTASYTVAYKLNLAFYESLGIPGLVAFQDTIEYLRMKYPEILIIADAKRGDIGNTSTQYAKAFFEIFDCDAVTVAPYMGKDSVSPFLKYESNWTIILDHTSNDGSKDLQTLHIEETGDLVYEHMLKKALEWGATPGKSMFVIGATKAESLQFVRKIVPDHFLLIPGVGAQGGSLEEVAKYGINKECGLLVNNSRGIIFASSERDFDLTARKKAIEMQQQMEGILMKYEIIK